MGMSLVIGEERRDETLIVMRHQLYHEQLQQKVFLLLQLEASLVSAERL